MTFLKASEIRQNVLNGNYTSVEFITEHFAHIDELNPQLNAIVVDMRDRAFRDAARLDNLLATGQAPGKLHGVPISIKEAFNIAGLPTTINFKPLKNNIAQSTSFLVQRAIDAGAIIVGKTNVPMMLSDSQTFGPLYPTCNNPFDKSRTPGGSTGGGAAAVASGMSCFELGSDIGGSIRNPSHYCGLFGLKPTQNGNAQDGHVPPLPKTNAGFSLMECTGPLARTMEDLRLAYDTYYQPRWDYLHYLPINTCQDHKPNLSHYRIGWYDHLGDFNSNSETQSALQNLLSTLKQNGAHIERVTLDKKWVQKVFDCWATLFGLMAAQDFRWGTRQLLKLKFRHDAKDSRINVLKALNKGLSLNFKAYSQALLELQELTAEFNSLFNNMDIVLSPTSAGPAFEHNHKHTVLSLNGTSIHYADYCFPFVLPFNAMGHPVLVVPAQTHPEKLPIGIQCIGQHHNETKLFEFGEHLERLGFNFRAPKNS